MLLICLSHLTFLACSLFGFPNIKEIIEGIREVLKFVFGENTPSWLVQGIGYFLLIGLTLLGIFALLLVLSKIKDLLTEKFIPLLYNKEKKRCAADRSKFADHIESELRGLNIREDWKDDRFAELEAEVDAEGRRVIFGLIPTPGAGSSLRRVRSLSKALRDSRERLILVEGDPGSGKSVALRHVAQRMAAKALRSKSTDTIIPIYVNLKELERKREKIDRNLIEAFVLRTLNRINDRDVDEFLEEEFNAGLKRGTWFFLFDSFDEIPEILSSTEADLAIEEYAQAISDFLHGLNSCRGVLASRFFRGPKQFGWPRFRILPLSEDRRHELIRRARLKPETQKSLLGQLQASEQSMRVMAGNPMFLSLLCSHMRSGYSFPENPHGVFESYIETRFERDKGRIEKHFRVKTAEVRTTAEMVAFCIAADQHLGLSPSRANIKSAAFNLELPLPRDFEKHLDALEYIKIARPETSTIVGEPLQFTFAHRRFQEYFATTVVLREPDRVPPQRLLLDARWRETAVVLCQTQKPEVIQHIITESERIIEALEDDELYHLLSEQTKVQTDGPVNERRSLGFNWPPKLLHVLGLLQEGFTRRLELLPDALRDRISGLLGRATQKGSLGDKKSALDVAGTVPDKTLMSFLRKAFRGESIWLRESAFLQVARLSSLPKDISDHIQSTLVLLLINGRLRKERLATHAHLSRLHNSDFFISLLNLLVWLPRLDLLLHLVSLLILLSINNSIPKDAMDMEWRTAFLMYIAFIATSLLFSILMFNAISPHSLNRRQFISASMVNVLSRSFMWVLVSGTFFHTNFFKQVPFLKGLLPPVLPAWAALSVLYLIIWVPAAFALASFYPRTIRPILWPLIPFITLYYVLKYLIFRLVDLIRKAPSNLSWSAIWFYFKERLLTIMEDWKVLGLIVIALAALFGIGIAFLGWMWNLLIAFPRIMIPILLVIALSVIIGFLLPLSSDALKWWRWKKSSQKQIGAHEFAGLLRQFYLGSFRLRLITRVRNENLIVVSYESIALIERLGWKYERVEKTEKDVPAISEQDDSSNSEISNSEFVLKLFARAYDNRKNEIVDEIYRLLEQMKAKALFT